MDQAEAYFAKIGFPLPPYVNPADFYMDVIAGLVKNERNVHINLFEEWEKRQMMVEDFEPEVEEVGKDEIGSISSRQSTSSRPASEHAPSRPSSQILINVKEVCRTSTQGKDSETNWLHVLLFNRFDPQTNYTQDSSQVSLSGVI